MPVRRDRRSGRWIFRTVVHKPDKTKERLFGTPGVPGPYHDLSNTRVGAQEAERRAISEVMHGKPQAVTAIPATKEAPKTIKQHADTFMANYKPQQKPSTKREKKSALNRLLPAFGALTPEQLKQEHIDSFAAAELRRGAARKSINNRLACLSSLIKYVTGEKSKLRFNVGGMAAEIHAVALEDIESLLAVCDDDRYRAVILLAAEAGLRAGEIRGLQWGDIKDGQLTVRRALDAVTDAVLPPKHDKMRTIPLSPRVAAVLEALPRRGLWIVSRLDGGALGYQAMKKAIRAVYDRAKLERPAKLIHCLRHTFGTVMARRVPLGVLQKLMGHADVQTTMRYVDVSESDKREAIALVFGRGSRVAAAKKETK